MPNDTILSVKGLTYIYDQRTTAGIRDVSFSIPRGKVTTLIGPSGSGKTTTLKIINNEITDFEGKIDCPSKEQIAYVNQTPNLDLNLTVFETMMMELSHLESEAQKENQCRTVIAQLELTNEINSKISHISGGQRQRVIIACALVKNPTLLLLDEPFANLDKNLRLEILNDLFSFFKEEEMTILWVTHNTEEALSYSDKLVLLNHGEIESIGAPRDLYFKPSNMFTANFFGETNIFATKVSSETESNILLNFNGSTIELPKNNFPIKDHKDILIIIRPECFILAEKGEHSGVIIGSHFKGHSNLIEVQTKDCILFIKASPFLKPNLNSIISFNLEVDGVHYLTEV